MKIAILHMTMGLVERGSEAVINDVANELSGKNQVTLIQSGKTTQTKYKAVRVMSQKSVPSPAPRSAFDKLLFRLGLNESARLVRAFTHKSLPTLQKINPDVVICVNGADQVRIIKQNLPKAKIVVFGHAGIGHDDEANIKARPNLFVALTKDAESWAKSFLTNNTKVIYLPNPINTAIYKKAKSYKHNLPRPVVLVVGAHTTYKNIPTAIAASSLTGSSLLLVGEGESEQEVSDILCNYNADFRWIKHIPHKEMPSIYMSADAFCFVPDTQEAFGMVYLEAMAAGLPIVATDDSIRHELIGTQGFYANNQDVSSVIKALEKALQSKKLSYAKELKSYSLQNIVKKLESELYEII